MIHMTWEYKHEPFTDFSDHNEQTAFKEALALVKKELGKEYPIVVGGKKIFTDDKITSENPANHSSEIQI